MEQARFDRLNGNVHDSRSIFDREPVKLKKLDCCSLPRRQFVHGHGENLLTLLLGVTLFRVQARIRDLHYRGAIFSISFSGIKEDLAQSSPPSQQHQGFVDRDPREPTGKGRPAFEFAQVYEGPLEASLQHVLGIPLVACNTLRQSENSPLVKSNQSCKGGAIPASGGSN